MLYDLKYHVATLVSVFLALALGILIGSALDDNGNNVQQQEKIVQSLKADFDTLRLKNQSLKVANDNLTQAESRSQLFGQHVMPALVSGKLAGKNIMLVVCGESSGGELARKISNLSGATVAKEIVFTQKYPTTAVLASDSGSISKSEVSSADRGKLLSLLSAKIVSDYAKGTESDIANKLTAQNALIMKTNRPAVVPDVVIVIGGYATAELSMVDFIDKPVIRSLVASGYRVIGAEESTIGYSAASEYKKMGISTVDDIDKPYGMLSLVYVAAGWDGHYGEKPEAEKLMPEKISPGGLVN